MPYLEDAYPTYATSRFSRPQWLEVIGNEQQGGESFSLEAGQATIPVQIPWSQSLQFVRFALGWSYLKTPSLSSGSSGSRALIRENPKQHPRYPWLTASNVAFQGVGPVGTPGVGTVVPGLFADSLFTARYDQCIATVTFADRPWAFKGDSGGYSPAQEAQRNVHMNPTPSVEIISAEGINNLLWANGPGFGGAGIPAPFGTLMSKVTYQIDWMWVPHEYISTTDYPVLTPAKILACVGRVNSDTFMGFAPGTLLLQAPIFTPFRFPIATADRTQGFFGWNVRLPVQFFDPDRGVADPAYRGHQCLPYRQNLKWYGAKRTLDGSKVFPEAVFANIFANANF